MPVNRSRVWSVVSDFWEMILMKGVSYSASWAYSVSLLGVGALYATASSRIRLYVGALGPQ